MNLKRGYETNGSDTAIKKKKQPLQDMPNLGATRSSFPPISKQPIPLSSIYYRLFETIENHPVPSYTIPLHQQISKFSPQTPRNKQRCVLGKCFL